MATRFSVPKSPSRDVLEISNFLGVDLTNSGTNISETRSPNAPNMIRDVPGKVRKRTGYKTIYDFCPTITISEHTYKYIPVMRNNSIGHFLEFPLTLTGETYNYIGVLAHKFIPKSQKWGIKIRYSCDATFSLRANYGSSEERFYLYATGNDIVEDTFIVDNDSFTAPCGYFYAYINDATKRLVLHDFKVFLLDNDKEYIDTIPIEEELTLSNDEMYDFDVTEEQECFSGTIHYEDGVYSNNIATFPSGFRRYHVTASVKNTVNVNDQAGWTSTPTFRIYNSNNISISFDSTGAQSEYVSVHETSDFYFYADLTEWQNRQIAPSGLVFALDKTQPYSADIDVTIVSCPASAKEFPQIVVREEDKYPIYGVHTLNLGGEEKTTGYQKNRIKYNFQNRSLHEELPLGTRWGTEIALFEPIVAGEKYSLYIKYSADYNFYLCLSSNGVEKWISLQAGQNREYRILNEAINYTICHVEVANTECDTHALDVVIDELAIYHVALAEDMAAKDVIYTIPPEYLGRYLPTELFYAVTSEETAAIAETRASTGSEWHVETYLQNCVITGLSLIDFSVTLTGGNGARLTNLCVFVMYRKIYEQTTHGLLKFELADTVEYGKAYNIVAAYVPKDGYEFLDIQIQCRTDRNSTVNFEISDIVVKTINYRQFFKNTNDIRLVHCGNKMYSLEGDDYILLSEEMNLHRSVSWQFDGNLYILDGKRYLRYESGTKTLEMVSNPEAGIADVPVVSIARPTGGERGGEDYQDLNLLSPAFEEWFNSETDTANTTACHLSYKDLDSTRVRAWVLQGATWVEKTEGTHFTVNRSAGIVTFNSKITNPLSGEDNIRIRASRTVEGYADKINKCTLGSLFGVNGACDRLFLSGNPDFINYDWHSEYYKPTYFPDTGYAKLGLDVSAVIGYSIINNYLAVHKDELEPTQSVIVREGDLIENEAAFKIINSLQGEGAIAPYSFAYLETEPLFLTRSGVMAITKSDITGDKYSQNRSFYANGQLTEESNLQDAFAVVYNSMYWLFINNCVYVLDGLQPTQTDKGAPYATRQYAVFYLTNIPATCAWTEDNELWFGTSGGKICRFNTDKEALNSYNDNGEAIAAWWETCDLDGKLFYKNKTFRYIAVRLKSNILTRAKLWSQTRGIWTLIKESKFLSNLVFQFSTLTFSTLTFNNDTSDKMISSKLRVKKIDKARFKIENSNLNEPLGIQNIALEYVESGNFKG